VKPPQSIEQKNLASDPLQRIPKHWSVAALKRVVETRITDGPHETPELSDDGIPFLSAEAVKNGKLDFDRKRGFITAVCS
jgi:type I restriction enzyme S subunit